MKDGWRGIMSIAASPFDENGVFLFDELARHADWIVRAGAHVAWPLGYSEFPSLSHAERIEGTKVVVEAVAGRAVCLIGVSAQCRQEAADYARRAAECGADGVVALLPRGFSAANYPLIKAYYAEIASAQQASRLLTLGLAAMLIIVTLVGSLGILNTLTLGVLERRREIAVMRAMGATHSALLLAFLAEGLALGGTGWVIGLVLGYPTGYLFTRQLGQVLFSLPFVMSPLAVLASFFFCLGLATLSSLGPAFGAAQVSASTALRYE